MKTSLTILMALTHFTALTSHAQSGANGGGSAIKFPDDTVVLADPYIPTKGLNGTFSCNNGEEGMLADDLVNELRLVGRLMVAYGADPIEGKKRKTPSLYIHPTPFRKRNWPEPITKPDYRYDIEWRVDHVSNFIQEHVFNPEVHYCFVNQLPKTDQQQLTLIQTSTGKPETIGWTEGKITWIKKDLFKKMNIREQAKTIVHERLHAYAGNVPLGPIIDITNGLAVLLEHYKKQHEGERRELTHTEWTAVIHFAHRMIDLGISHFYAHSISIWRNGGGMRHVDNYNYDYDWVDPSAFIGIGSRVTNYFKIGKNTVVLNSGICSYNNGSAYDNYTDSTENVRNSNLIIGESAEIIDSELFGCEKNVVIGDYAKIKNSTIAFNTYTSYINTLSLKDHSQIIQSEIYDFGFLSLEKNAQVVNVRLDTNDRPPNYFTRVRRGILDEHRSLIQLQLGENTALKNMTGAVFGAMARKNMFAPLHVQPRITLTANQTFDFENSTLCPPSKGDLAGWYSSDMGHPRMTGMNLFFKGEKTYEDIESMRRRCPRP